MGNANGNAIHPIHNDTFSDVSEKFNGTQDHDDVVMREPELPVHLSNRYSDVSDPSEKAAYIYLETVIGEICTKEEHFTRVLGIMVRVCHMTWKSLFL